MDLPPVRAEGPVVLVVDHVSPYSLGIVNAVREVLLSQGVPLLVHVDDFFTTGTARSWECWLERGRVRGVIAVPLSTPRAHADLEALLAAHPGLPVVSLSGAFRGRASVVTDSGSGMAALVEHVLALPGVRSVALVRGMSHHVDSRARETVVREVLAGHGLHLAPGLVVDGDFERDRSYREVAALLAAGHRPDAVLALNDAGALGALDAVLDAGLRVPEDVVVTGFDDDGTTHPRCTLTTVSQDLAVQGRTAAELLLELLAGAPGRDVVLPTRLVVRGSSARTATPAAAAPGAPGVPADALLSLNRAFMACADEEALVAALSTGLSRLRISRCFVVLREPGATTTGRLVLVRPGADPAAPLDAAPFPLADVLPPTHAHHLERGLLLMQALTVPGRELGHVLYEQSPLDGHTAEALPIDLSLALDGLARRRDLEDAVVRRTEQLREEVAVRRRAEAALQRANAELRRSLHRDGLTGIANRTAFDAHLARAWAQQRALAEDLSVLFVDVDCFKLYNDTYGHLRGDEALRAVAAALEAACRGEDDLAARIGGEEFTVALPGTGADGAAVVAERVCQGVRRQRVEHTASPVVPWLTVSVGVATVRPGTGLGPQDLLAAADGALYGAKAAGRDRVTRAGAVVVGCLDDRVGRR